MLGTSSKAPRRSSGNGANGRNGSDRSMTILAVQGEHARFQGKLQIADSVEVQCEVGGELEVGGKLIIGENGAVHADVRTVDAIILGSYEGNMIATGDVQIAATGRVRGSVKTDSLVITEGGFFNGSVSEFKNDRPGREHVELVDEEPAEPEAHTKLRRVESS